MTKREGGPQKTTAWVRKAGKQIPLSPEQKEAIRNPERTAEFIKDMGRKQEEMAGPEFAPVLKGAVPGGPQISEEMLITPKMAEEWLTRNVHNRPVSDATVNKFALDMANGKWTLTHQGIAFDTRHRLADGQHRLWAIFMSGVPVKMMVTDNLSPESIAHIDMQRVRSVSDVLKLQYDMPNSRKLGARTVVIRDIEEPDRARVPLSVDQTLEIYHRHKAGLDWSLQVLGGEKMKLWPAAPVAGALAYAYPTDPSKINEFAEKLKSGEGLSKGNPILTLREYLLREGDMAGVTNRKVAMISTLRCAMAYCKGDAFLVIKPQVILDSEQIFRDVAKFFSKAHKK